MTTPTSTQHEFETLLSPVLPTAYRAALHFTRTEADAEDAVQQAALQAWRAFGRFESGTNFRAWFLRIVTNVCRSEFRRTKRSPVKGSLDAPEFDEAIIPLGVRDDREPTPDAALVSGIETEEITQALASLPEEYRLVASLYFLEELSYQEIANIVDRPIGTVRSRLHRGRKMLMQKLWSLAEERGLVTREDRTEDFEEFFAEETRLVA